MEQVPLAAITRSGVQVVVAAAITNDPVTDTAGLLNVRLAPVLLVKVILVAALGTPTAVVANVIDVGLRTTLLVPVPVRPISCGLEGSLSFTTTEPRFAPVDAGVKLTVILQLAPPARLAPDAGHALVTILKSAVSVKVMEPIVIAVVALLATVKTLLALVVFTTCLPKSTGAPAREMALPSPVTLTVLVWLKKPLVTIVTVPLLVPEPVGTKYTYMVQVVPLVRLAGQSSASLKPGLV